MSDDWLRVVPDPEPTWLEREGLRLTERGELWYDVFDVIRALVIGVVGTIVLVTAVWVAWFILGAGLGVQ